MRSFLQLLNQQYPKISNREEVTDMIDPNEIIVKNQTTIKIKSEQNQMGLFSSKVLSSSFIKGGTQYGLFLYNEKGNFIKLSKAPVF